MERNKKFDDDFLEDQNFKKKDDKKLNFDKVFQEAVESSICIKETKTYLTCLKENRMNCEELKTSIVTCYKNCGRL
jgi:hypothetical protein